jgi:hypothetical protein
MDEMVAGLVLVNLLKNSRLYTVRGCEWFERSGKFGKHLPGFSDPCLAKQAAGGQMSLELGQLFSVEGA